MYPFECTSANKLEEFIMAKAKKLANGKYAIRPRFKDPITDEWTSKYGTFEKKSDAEQWASKIMTDAQRGTTHRSIDISWYAEHWLSIYKIPMCDVKTIKGIRADLRRFTNYFGLHKRLKNVNPGVYQMFLNDLGTKYSKNTCLHVHNTCRAMMRKAQFEGYIRQNPAIDAYVSGTPRQLKSPRASVLDMSEFKKLMTVVWNTDICVGQAVVLTHAYTGMRFGEACGLTWDKIDFAQHIVYVSQMFDYCGTRQMKCLKGGGKPRYVPVEPKYFQYLFRYRSWYQNKIANKTMTPYHNFCFTSWTGKPISDSGINQYIAKKCLEAGVPRITNHGFRRTLASLLNLAGTNVNYIASILGHADITTTYKYYIKTTDDIIKQGNALKQTFFQENNL